MVFFEKAFGIKASFIHESGAYAELSTGETALAFASEELGEMNLPAGYQKNRKGSLPLGAEIVLTVDDVQAVFEKAVAKGGEALATPQEKPWGQTVAYLRDPNGVLIELAS